MAYLSWSAAILTNGPGDEHPRHNVGLALRSAWRVSGFDEPKDLLETLDSVWSSVEGEPRLRRRTDFRTDTVKVTRWWP